MKDSDWLNFSPCRDQRKCWDVGQMCSTVSYNCTVGTTSSRPCIMRQLIFLAVILLASLPLSEPRKAGFVNGPCGDDDDDAGHCPHSTSCRKDERGAMRCLHKPLLPFNGADYTAMALLFFSCALAAGGGIGGGGLLVTTHARFIDALMGSCFCSCPPLPAPRSPSTCWYSTLRRIKRPP